MIANRNVSLSVSESESLNVNVNGWKKATVAYIEKVVQMKGPYPFFFVFHLISDSYFPVQLRYLYPYRFRWELVIYR